MTLTEEDARRMARAQVPPEQDYPERERFIAIDRRIVKALDILDNLSADLELGVPFRSRPHIQKKVDDAILELKYITDFLLLPPTLLNHITGKTTP